MWNRPSGCSGSSFLPTGRVRSWRPISSTMGWVSWATATRLRPLRRGCTMRELSEKIRRREARCGVIGLGYVGLPLALEFARAGFRVTGVDLDRTKIDAINGGRSYIVDLDDREIA